MDESQIIDTLAERGIMKEGEEATEAIEATDDEPQKKEL
eukprot:CAMPEP_0168517962 /NCGR_PEP_ID=MMETSP0405-20121227/6414_1 /TAXON_ID=498012 /ORGANISM="Trichosphaerium sp, Strain Am-I-7 wt" /LENGTH=38 /DNA_ID= /DNA_START= /DNA_END= /DNA_ORIENTATION=